VICPLKSLLTKSLEFGKATIGDLENKEKLKISHQHMKMNLENKQYNQKLLAIFVRVNV
jgi:hypothetical protein